MVRPSQPTPTLLLTPTRHVDNASKEKDAHKRQHRRHRPPSKNQAFAQSPCHTTSTDSGEGAKPQRTCETEPRLRSYSTVAKPDQLDQKGATASAKPWRTTCVDAGTTPPPQPGRRAAQQRRQDSLLRHTTAATTDVTTTERTQASTPPLPLRPQRHHNHTCKPTTAATEQQQIHGWRGHRITPIIESRLPRRATERAPTTAAEPIEHHAPPTTRDQPRTEQAWQSKGQARTTAPQT